MGEYMNKQQQSGFTLVEILLVIIALTLIGFGGWYVWDANQNKKETSGAMKTSTADAKQDTTTEPAEPNPTKDWKPYTNTAGAYSLRYPTSWVTAPNADMCGPEVFLLGSSAELVGRCASDSGGQIYIGYSEAGSGGAIDLAANGYENVTTKTVTVAGVSAQRQTGSITQEPEGIGPAAGTKSVQYRFTKNGKAYVASYTQAPGTIDITADFDLLVTKTFSVN
jgi:type II secretory pathway pseudopilin PulG